MIRELGPGFVTEGLVLSRLASPRPGQTSGRTVLAKAGISESSESTVSPRYSTCIIDRFYLISCN